MCAKENSILAIRETRREVMEINLAGETPLLCCKYNDDDLDPAKKKNMVVKGYEGYDEEYIKYFYDIDPAKGRYGFPAEAFRQTLRGAASYLGQATKITPILRGGLNVIPDVPEFGYVELKYEEISVLKAYVNIQKKKIQRLRPLFHDWSVKLKIMYDAERIDFDSIVRLYAVAGAHIGVGDWRPQTFGTYGMFKVGSAGQV